MSFAVSNSDSDNDSEKWFIRIQRQVQYFLSVSTISSTTRNLWAGSINKEHTYQWSSTNTNAQYHHTLYSLSLLSLLPSPLYLPVCICLALSHPCFSHILHRFIFFPSKLLVPISFLLSVFNVLSHNHNITNNVFNLLSHK